MKSTTFDIAKKCPRCGNYGAIVGERPRGGDGSKLYTLLCETVLCTWYNTTWVVEVNAEGKVPTRDDYINPTFGKRIDELTEEEAIAIVKQINDSPT